MYPMEWTDADRLANEHYLMALTEEDGRKVPHRLSDSCIRLGGKLYHIECQSTNDGDILVRLVEYNMQIGLENAVSTKGGIEVELPQSALLMLQDGRPGEDKHSEQTMTYRHGKQRLDVSVPVLKVQAYSMEEIYEKKLYFLIPYYAMRYKEGIERIAQNELEYTREYDTIYTELKAYFERLQQAYENSEITEDEGKKLTVLSRLILNHLTRKLSPEKGERLVSTVGGKVLEMPGDREFIQGFKQGEQVGEKRGEKRGEQRGIQKEHSSAVEKLAVHYMAHDTSLTKEQALEMAESILR